MTGFWLFYFLYQTKQKATTTEHITGTHFFLNGFHHLDTYRIAIVSAKTL